MRSSRFIALLVLAACGDIEPVAPTHQTIVDGEQLFMSLTLDHPAILMSTVAPYNTLQLTATPRNALGQPITGLPAATFRSTDTTRVWVTPEGLLQARRAGNNVRIIAEVVAPGNIRHVDTARVNVTTNPAPPRLTTFSITPHADSAVWTVVPGAAPVAAFLVEAGGIPTSPTLPLRALDANGAPIPSLPIEYESLDPDVVVFLNTATGDLWPPHGLGQARLVARTTAYGIAKVDTAEFTVKLPIVNAVTTPIGGDNLFIQTRVTIQRNGFVFWTNNSRQPTDVTFDDPTNVATLPAAVCEAATMIGSTPEILCGAGNIAAFATDAEPTGLTNIRARHFPVAGTYNYRTMTGQTGQVVVVEDP